MTSEAVEEIKKKGLKGRRLLWVNTLQDEIIKVLQTENAGEEDLLRVAKKLEKKCIREIKRIKGPVRASKLAVACSDILRSLKLLSNEINDDDDSKILAALGLLLTFLITAASKSKESQNDARKSASQTYGFLKRILGANTEWMFNTVLASGLCELPLNSFSFWLLSSILRDPSLSSYNATVLNNVMAVTQVLSGQIEAHGETKLQVAEFWTKEPEFFKRSENCNVTSLIKATKKTVRIRISKSSRSLNTNFGSGGVQWVLSSTPSELPADFQFSDHEEDVADISDDDSRDVNDYDLPSTPSKSTEVLTVEDNCDSDDGPISKRTRLSQKIVV